MDTYTVKVKLFSTNYFIFYVSISTFLLPALSQNRKKRKTFSSALILEGLGSREQEDAEREKIKSLMRHCEKGLCFG